jgi:hypothetical protein
MNIILGRGNNRQTFSAPAGASFRALQRDNPVEAVKITGNLLALVRQQPKIRIKEPV